MKKEKLFLSEDLDNLDIIADEDMESVVAIPPVMAAEYKLAKRREKLIKDRFKEQDKLKNSKNAFTGRTDKKIKNLEKLNLTESFFVPEDLSDQAQELADDLAYFLDRTSGMSNLSDFLDEYDLDNIAKSMEALYFFANNYKAELKEDAEEDEELVYDWYKKYHPTDYQLDNIRRDVTFKDVYGAYKANKDVEDILVDYTVKDAWLDSAPVETIINHSLELYEESLKEGKHEEQEPLDLWTRVYNELATDIAPSEAKFREVPAPRGSRYNEMATDVNGNIIVYSPTDKDLDFARKVCDHYNCKYRVKEDTNKKTNAYYKYFMIIEIPEEE
jgi:hypothetical protein